LKLEQRLAVFGVDYMYKHYINVTDISNKSKVEFTLNNIKVEVGLATIVLKVQIRGKFHGYS
jgi:hypothetical protein